MLYNLTLFYMWRLTNAIYHGEGVKCPHQTPKSKVIATPNLTCRLVFSYFFRTMCFELMRHHCDIMAIFEKHSHFCNDVTCGSNFVPRFNSWYWIKCLIQSNCVTKTCCDVVLVKFSPKMLRFRKVTLGNIKIGKLLVTLATSKFHELFAIKFDSNSNWFEMKI